MSNYLGVELVHRDSPVSTRSRAGRFRREWKKLTSVDLFEYQARDLFEKYGVPVLPGITADTPAEVRAAAE